MLVRTPMSRMIDRMIQESTTSNNSYYPMALNVVENDEGFTITTTIAGADAENINIRIHDDMLTIEAETSAPELADGERALLSEIRYGTFRRNLRFNTHVDSSSIEASYDNGLLSIFVGKAEEAKPRQIPVKAGNA